MQHCPWLGSCTLLKDRMKGWGKEEKSILHLADACRRSPSTMKHCGTTVEQNMRLLCERTGFDFTLGQCLVSDKHGACLIPLRNNTQCLTVNRGRKMKMDVHFVMSAALPLANYISYVVQTCTRRNFKCYPINMHEIVFTMWLLGVIKMWCHQLCLKNMDPKAKRSGPGPSLQ